MPMTNAERQKRHREKRKAERIAAREKYMRENGIVIIETWEQLLAVDFSAALQKNAAGKYEKQTLCRDVYVVNLPPAGEPT